MESDDERVATVACQAILDRAFGRPHPTTDTQEKIEDSIASMTPEARLARLRELTEKALETLAQDALDLPTLTEAVETEE